MTSAETISLFAAAIVGVATFAHGDQRTHRWTDSFCTHTIRYDDQREDLGRIRNTADLIAGETPVAGACITPPVSTPKRAASFDATETLRDCAAGIDRLTKLDLLGWPELESYRAFIVENLRDQLAFAQAFSHGLKGEPHALKTYTPAAACARFAEVLEPGRDLETIWQETVRSHCARFADVAACERNAAIDRANPDADAWMRLRVLNFGWNNCAAKFLRANTIDMRPAQEKLARRFRMMFRQKSDCSASD